MAYRSWYGFRPYVSVASRQAKADKHVEIARKKGEVYEPVRTEGRKIARSFWGDAWCRNLEAYSDYSNRLPRGRSYLSSGQVLDLKLGAGSVDGLVMGSSLYRITIRITPLAASRWKAIRKECAGTIGSLVELLQGKLSSHVMRVVTRQGSGLFPAPSEIKMSCSCPDWAALCKHLAAVLYGVGARLDEKPELLFLLRGVDHLELIGAAAEGALSAVPAAATETIAESDLADLFGIQVEAEEAARPEPARRPRRPSAPALVALPPPAAASRRRKPADPAKPAKARPAAAKTTTTQALVSQGVTRSTIQNWLLEGVLVKTATRGVYGATPATQTRLRSYLKGKKTGR